MPGKENPPQFQLFSENFESVRRKVSSKEDLLLTRLKKFSEISKVGKDANGENDKKQKKRETQQIKLQCVLQN